MCKVNVSPWWQEWGSKTGLKIHRYSDVGPISQGGGGLVFIVIFKTFIFVKKIYKKK